MLADLVYEMAGTGMRTPETEEAREAAWVARFPHWRKLSNKKGLPRPPFGRPRLERRKAEWNYSISRHEQIAERPLRAMCGRLRVGKDFLHGCSMVGAAMCSAC
jgi:hypothetical protein